MTPDVHSDRNLSLALEALRRRVHRFRAAPAKEGPADAPATPDEVAASLASAAEELRVAEEELIVARAHAEAERDRYEELFQNAPDAYLVTDTHASITESNLAAAALLNVPVRYLSHKPLVVYVQAEDREGFWATIRHARAAGRGERLLRLLPRQRPPVPVHVTLSPLVAWNGELLGFRWILRDVTEQQRSRDEVEAHRAQLRSLAAELGLAEERERRRIASLIHDEIGQNLAVLSMQLASLQQPLAVRDPDAAAKLGEARDTLRQIVRQSRSLTFELSPPMLYELGLGAALQWLVEQKSSDRLRFSFRGARRAEALPPLPQDLAVLLFQATRELMVNVVKHAHANHAVVSLCVREGVLIVRVEDDGVGFDPQIVPAPAPRGYGLFSIRERLHRIGGNVLISRGRRGGTRVELSVRLGSPTPLAPSNGDPHHEPDQHPAR